MSVVLEKQLPKGWTIASLSEISIINPKLEKNNLDSNLDVSFIPMKCVEEMSGKIKLSDIKKVNQVRKGFTNFKTSCSLIFKT